MGRYEERIGTMGFTKRERDVNYSRDYYRRRLLDSISCKDVLIEGEPAKLIIDKGTKPYYKKFRGYLEDQIINVGDYVQWADRYWLVANADADHELFTDGELYECNYKLRWQDETGKIIERWTHIQNASAYNTGEEFAYGANLGSNELGLLIPIDEDTKKLERDRRFYMDFTNKKIRYKFTRIDSVCDTYGSKGLLYIIAMEDVERHERDNDELEICDYFEPDSPINETDHIISVIDYNTNVLKLGGAPRRFDAVFLDQNNEQVYDITAEWKFRSTDWIDFDYEIDGNTIMLSCNDQSAIGKSFKLVIGNEGMESSIDVIIANKY